MRKRNKKEKGFTLVELLIVVAIIAILTGIAIPNFMGARTKARVGKAFAEMDQIATAEQMYELDHEEFTGTMGDLTPGYIKHIPDDPWGEAYRIEVGTVITTNDGFVILSNGPDTTPDISASNLSWSTNDLVKGAIGGGAGADSAYGITTQAETGTEKWYHPSGDGDGDIGYGSSVMEVESRLGSNLDI